jgi:predicted lipid-binding transport protein (Tim44 family)
MTALLAVFLAGAATGAFALKSMQRAYAANGAKAMRNMDRKELMEFFRKELKLDNDQKQRVEALLEDHFKMLQMLGAQTEEVRAHGRESIAKLLTEEQRQKFDRLMTDWQKSKL